MSSKNHGKNHQQNQNADPRKELEKALQETPSASEPASQEEGHQSEQAAKVEAVGIQQEAIQDTATEALTGNAEQEVVKQSVPEAAKQVAPQKQNQSHKSHKEHNVVTIEQQLVTYLEVMEPGAIQEPATLGQWQKSLYQLLLKVLENKDPAAFRREWNTILNVANKNRQKAFHENYVFRAPAHWNLSDSEANLFRRLLSVVIDSCNPDTRQAFAKQVMLDRVTVGMSETAINNLLNFYS